MAYLKKSHGAFTPRDFYIDSIIFILSYKISNYYFTLTVTVAFFLAAFTVIFAVPFLTPFTETTILPALTEVLTTFATFLLLEVTVTLSVVFFLLSAALTVTVTFAFLPFFTETLFLALRDFTAFFLTEGAGEGVGSGEGVGTTISAGFFSGS